ncbi:cytochrome P450 [Sphingomonas sp. GB1N7]|uniref:cytochrome P450 n=1 Tax=Parasphingomonas caseinilytica TaxID=3096158 RepID=UPI002FC85DCD
MSRYDDVRDALRDHATFSSAAGVGADDAAARQAIGTLIASDPPEHDKLRKVMMVPLSPSSVSKLREVIARTADDVVERLVERGTFEMVTDAAQALPLAVVSHLVGLPEEGRENMLRWAAATFDVLGPANDRAAEARPHVMAMRAYAASVAKRGLVTPGGWADRLLDLADAGEIEPERVPSLFRDFMAPSLDTTILATASLFWLLGEHPDQWELLHDDLSLLRGAINEAVRIESPIRGFTRLASKDVTVDGSPIPAGARVLMLYASANRDERKWDDPDRFDIRRRNADQLGFGFGVHSCAGMHLARLEMECLMTAFLTRVRRFTVSSPQWALNNTLRGLASLQVSVEV